MNNYNTVVYFITAKLGQKVFYYVSHSSYFNINFQTQASEGQECDDECQKNPLDKPAPTQIVISKLNPEVQEFVPKNIKSTNDVPRNHSFDCNTLQELNNGKHSPETHKEAPIPFKNDTKYPNSRKQTLSQKSSQAHETGRNGAGDNGRVIYKDIKDKQCIMPDETKVLLGPEKYKEKKKMIAVLREIISKIPKDSPFDKRQDRNVAIATLVKANTIPSPTNLCEQKPVLLTPDYFKGPSASEDLDTQHKENVVPSRMSPPKLLGENKANNIENVEDNTIEENITSNLEVASVGTPVDPHMQESINKVNNWFSAPPRSKPAEQNQGAISDIPKAKPAEPYLGTCTFKKKSVPGQNSPVSSPSTSKSPVSVTPSYIPSKHAQDLAKKYEERKQVKEEHIDIWTKLERDLKIKDEEFRQRIRERAAQNDTNNALSIS